eukprot:SAG31_NODE_3492_length_4201_cov_3.139444_2_plen_86_part_00
MGIVGQNLTHGYSTDVGRALELARSSKTPEETIDRYQPLLRIDPSNEAAKTMVASSLKKLGRLKEAAQASEQAMKENPMCPIHCH